MYVCKGGGLSSDTNLDRIAVIGREEPPTMTRIVQ